MAQTTVLNPLLPARVVYQYSSVPSWIENLAVRSNGQILCTFISAPEVHLIDPSDSSKTTLLHSFPEVKAFCGIIEVENDKFYVVGGKFDLAAFSNEAGTYKLWEIDMTDFDTSGEAAVTEVMDVEKIVMPNGLELLSKSEKIILAADCVYGAVFKIDIANKTHEIMVDCEEMKIPPNPFIPLSINGIAVNRQYLYWTNTARAMFCRVKIDKDGKAAGDVEVLHQGLVADDFCFDRQGNAWITQNPLNVITVAKASGGLITVSGKLESLEVAGATACQFDRRPGKTHLLYLVTCGGLSGPVNGSEVEPGKVSVIDTLSFFA
jgi:hypothetical protein